MKKVISRCPVCNNELTVARLKCECCDTVIENNFRLSKFDYLSDEELYFTETFNPLPGEYQGSGEGAWNFLSHGTLQAGYCD